MTSFSTLYATNYDVNVVRPERSCLPSNVQYDVFFEDWLTMWDTAKGEREVKTQGSTYLKMTLGQSKDTELGLIKYEAYKNRAIFFDYVSETIMGMFGLFWQKDPAIGCSDFITQWMKNASIRNNTFMECYRELVYNLIWKGRYGFLIDIPDSTPGKDTPQMVPYVAESIVNWGCTIYKGKQLLNFVLLDESNYDLDPKTLKYSLKVRWRLCGLQTIDINGNELNKPVYFTVSNEGKPSDVDFSQFMIQGYTDTPNLIYPNYKGKTLEYIPFVFGNVTNTLPDIQKPPLLGLANISLAIYRGDADYREALYKQAQATLFGKGIENKEDVPTGAGSCITTTDKDADLKYVETSGAGLSSMRDAEKDLKETAIQMGISLTQKSSGDETGASVQRHITVRTSTLKAISTTAGDVMSQVIKIVLDWTGRTDEEFTLIPSQDFSTASETADGFLKMWQAFKDGAMTSTDFYEWQKYNEYTTYPTYEEWWKEMQSRFNFIENSQIQKETKMQDIINKNKEQSINTINNQ